MWVLFRVGFCRRAGGVESASRQPIETPRSVASFRMGLEPPGGSIHGESLSGLTEEPQIACLTGGKGGPKTTKGRRPAPALPASNTKKYLVLSRRNCAEGLIKTIGL